MGGQSNFFKMKKKPLSLLLALAFVSFSFGQTVSDDFTWVDTDSTNSDTSGELNFCNDQRITYTVSSTGLSFWNVTSNTPTLSGMIVPASILSSVDNVPMNFTFSQTVCNLRIHFTDLDDNSGSDAESLSAISPAYNNLTGGLMDLGGFSTGVYSPTNNGQGWIEWDGPLNGISFTYNRKRGCGLIIDSITFDCCPCQCSHIASVVNFGSLTSSGFASTTINLNSNGVAVRSISVEMPFYVSNTDKNCLKCDVPNQGSFGTIVSGETISGTAAALYDPLGMGYSRTIRWDFPTPTVINQDVDLGLQFPPVLELSCCKNAADYCLHVVFKNEDCTMCEYDLCTKEDQSRVGSKKTKVELNDGSFGQKKSDSFNLIPNPAKNKLEILLLDNTLVGGKVVFTNMSGMTMMETKMKRMKEEFDISKLSPGSYLVVINNNDKVYTKTLIVQ